MNKPLMHDTAVAMATHLVERLGARVREERRRRANADFYLVCVAGLEAYEERRSPTPPSRQSNYN